VQFVISYRLLNRNLWVFESVSRAFVFAFGESVSLSRSHMARQPISCDFGWQLLPRFRYNYEDQLCIRPPPYVLAAVSSLLWFTDNRQSILPESSWSKSLRADRIGERLNVCQYYCPVPMTEKGYLHGPKNLKVSLKRSTRSTSDTTSNVLDSLWDFSTTFRRRRDFQFRLQIFRRRVGIFSLFFLCCFYFLLQVHVNFYISTFALSNLYSSFVHVTFSPSEICNGQPEFMCALLL